ncbi:MAG TPA: alpha/beta hydrolase [Candidatus Elarobacter sp.]|nr:alpha/beta hydrolase [Candidatus Elarobacter sp.]
MPAGATDSRSQAVSAAAGGTVTLAGGSSVTIAPGALSQNAVVQLAYMPQANLTSPSANFTAAAPALHVAFFGAGSPTSAILRRVRADGTSPPITLRFKLPPDAIPNFDSFALPILRIYGAGGTSTDISGEPQFDAASGFLSFALPSSLPTFTQGMDLFFSRLASTPTGCGLQGKFAPGLRYYDHAARAWKTGAPPTRPVHPLLLLHGVFSCIEQSFLPATVELLRQDGGYDVVMGYDYDYLHTPDSIIPQMAADLNGFGLRHVDIAGHSYGAVIAMALAPKLNVSAIDNMILYAGPLDGAYFANPDFAYTLLLYFGDTIALPIGEAGLILSADWRSTFIAGNPRLAAIRSAMMSASNAPTRVIKIAGSKPYDKETAVFQLLFSTSPPAWDGVVAQSSALLQDVQGQPRKGFFVTVPTATLPIPEPQNHTNLVNNHIIEEGDVAPALAFEFNDADPSTHLYPPGGGIVFLKGVGSASYVAFLYTGGPGTATLDRTTLDTQHFSGAPDSVPTAQSVDSETDANFFRAALTQSPATLFTSTPTNTMQFDLHTQSGQIYPHDYTMNYYAFPPCSSCLGQSPTDIQRLIRDYQRMPSPHGGRAMVPVDR